MSDSIRRPAGVDIERPDASFNDDAVGGRLKSDEASRIRQAADRYLQKVPKRIQTEAEQVVETSPFRRAHDEPGSEALARQAKRQVGMQYGQPQRSLPRSPQKFISRASMDAQRIEQRIELLMGSMMQVAAALAAMEEDKDFAQTHQAESDEEVARQMRVVDRLLDEEDQDDGEQRDDEEEEPLQLQHKEESVPSEDRSELLLQKMAELEQAAKFQLQQLMAGGVGLTLMNDPLLTFKRLFDRLSIWPPGISPGYRPKDDADINAFLSWVFQPSLGWDDIEPL